MGDFGTLFSGSGCVCQYGACVIQGCEPTCQLEECSPQMMVHSKVVLGCGHGCTFCRTAGRATLPRWMYSQRVYFEPTVGGEVRIFGFYTNKQTNKKSKEDPPPSTGLLGRPLVLNFKVSSIECIC